MTSPELTLKKCGVRFKPPAIVVLYTLTATGKQHRRTMPLRNFNKNSGVTRVAEELKSSSRHRKYLAALPLPQLEKMVALIQDHMKGIALAESLQKNKALDTVDPEEDLNKVDEVTLKRKKNIMEQTFEKHQKKPGEPGFEYDIEVDFAGGSIESCEWDSDKDTEDEF